jgi:WD40 repeat protein/tRNA A-37 threonylcarbamoyl transferase component Bud32
VDNSNKTFCIDESQLVEVLPGPASADFGDYKLLGEIASGAMGVVYRAHQVSLNRTVALKMIRAGRLAAEEEIRRFRVEAEAAAALDHPNIVPIYEIGAREGHNFFTMKLVEGRSLSAMVEEFRKHDAAWLRRVVVLVVKICRAIQHAHERGVLHRDIKPGNILLDEAGEPHVTDFGLAKLVENDTQATMSGAIMGTPAYMAPEQAAGNTRGITTASDVYAVGAILYELVSGRRPFTTASITELLEQVRSATPSSPREFNPAVSRDLETICFKCLEKEPAQRYATAAALADELERWLAGVPILARPIGAWERLLKWTRRNPLLASAYGAVGLCALAGAVGITWQWRVARMERAQSFALNARLETQKAEGLFAENNSAAGLASLARVLRDDPANRVAAARIVNRLYHHQTLVPLSEPLGAGASLAVFAPDGRLVMSGTNSDGAVLSVFPRLDGSDAAHLANGASRIIAQAVSGDGRMIAAGHEDGARVWHLPGGATAREFRWATPVPFVGFASVDNKPALLAVTNDSVLLCALDNGAALQRLPTSGEPIVTATLSPDGNRLAAASASGAIWMRELTPSAQWQVASNAHESVIRALAFSANGAFVVSAGADKRARVWPFGAGEAAFTFETEQSVLDAAFGAADTLVVTAGRDGVAQVWSTRNGKAVGAAMKHPKAVNTARFSLDGQWVLTACDDGVVRLWRASTGELMAAANASPRQLIGASFSPDGRRIVTVAEGLGARVWTLAGGQRSQRAPLDAGVSVSNLFPRRIELPRAEQAAYAAAHTDVLTFTDTSADGTLAATASRDRTACLWNRRDGQPVSNPLAHDAPVNCAQFSADGATLVTSTSSRKIRLWDARSGQPISDWLNSPGPVARVCLSADNHFVVTADGWVWEVFAGQTPPPAWLPDLAESVAGIRYQRNRVAQPVPAGILGELKRTMTTASGTNWMDRWAKEFLNEIPIE